jgi:cytochrome c biogenesis protein CcmG, thiol:disulfide interchange protein DsbE
MAPLRFLCATALTTVLAVGCGAPPDAGRAAVGRPFPGLRLAALAAPAAPGPAVPAGRNVVLNVWATWCEPCRREMASLGRLARETDELDVVGVSIDQDANLAREFLLAQDVRFANYSDPGGPATRAALAVEALPQTFIIARDGTLVARIVGPRDWAGDAARSMLRETLALSGGSGK